MTLLEDDVTDLQDEVEEIETDINQLDGELLLVEGNVAGNIDDIDGNSFVVFKNTDQHKIFSLKPRNGMFLLQSFRNNVVVFVALLLREAEYDLERSRNYWRNYI